MAEIEGALLAILFVAAIVLGIAWLWLVWVAIGEIMVWLAIQDTLILHIFMWVLGNALCTTGVRK